MERQQKKKSGKWYGGMEGKEYEAPKRKPFLNQSQTKLDWVKKKLKFDMDICRG